MKRLFTNLFVFVLLTGIIDYGVGLSGDYLQRHAKGGKTKEFNDLVRNVPYDVVVLGSSRALHHYDAPFLSDTLGFHVYNAGREGHGIILAEGILELVLQHSHPKLILYDVEPAFDIYSYPPDNHDKRYLAYLKAYAKDSAISRIFKDVSMEEWMKVHFGMYRYNTSIITMLVDNLVARPSPENGYVPFGGVMENEPDSKVVLSDEIDPLKIEYAQRMISLAQSHDIPIAFVASPKYGERDSSELFPVRQLCERNQVPFWDFYAHPLFSGHKEWFQESVHLNGTGARVFSEMLVNNIHSIL